MSKQVSVEHAVRILNEMLLLDREATTRLFDPEKRVPCNEQIFNHPTIQVGCGSNGEDVVGILGVLNGIFGKNALGRGEIVLQYGHDGKIEKFLEKE